VTREMKLLHPMFVTRITRQVEVLSLGSRRLDNVLEDGEYETRNKLYLTIFLISGTRSI